jgi:hypothetical protein
MKTSLIKASAKALIPHRGRVFLRKLHRRMVFARAFHAFQLDPLKACRADHSRVFNRLVYGWGNEQWSALEEYLRECIGAAYRCKGAILECGSGLSTLMVGSVAAQRGLRYVALEHSALWADRVRSRLRRFRLEPAIVCDAPLKDFGDFSWYDTASLLLPEQWSLIICDGPPANTKGGRAGLLPIMREQIHANTTILLDDGERDGELAIAKDWAKALGADMTVHGVIKPYIRIEGRRLPVAAD